MSQNQMQIADYTKQLTRLQQRLLLAARAEDWALLRASDNEIIVLVKKIHEAGLKDQLSAPLSSLRQNYQHVMSLLQNEMSRTQTQMQQLNQIRPGVLAYKQTIEGGLE